MAAVEPLPPIASARDGPAVVVPAPPLAPAPAASGRPRSGGGDNTSPVHDDPDTAALEAEVAALEEQLRRKQQRKRGGKGRCGSGAGRGGVVRLHSAPLALGISAPPPRGP